jgi:hypothetical protein
MAERGGRNAAETNQSNNISHSVPTTPRMVASSTRSDAETHCFVQCEVPTAASTALWRSSASCAKSTMGAKRTGLGPKLSSGFLDNRPTIVSSPLSSEKASLSELPSSGRTANVLPNNNRDQTSLRTGINVDVERNRLTIKAVLVLHPMVSRQQRSQQHTTAQTTGSLAAA